MFPFKQFDIKKEMKEERVESKMITFLELKPNYDEIDFPSELLRRMIHVHIYDMQNMMVYGKGGCGKTVHIYAFLASLLGTKDIYSIKTNVYEEDRKEIQFRYSPYHIEFSPLDLMTHESVFIKGFLKEYVKSMNVSFNIPKIVYIKNAEHLSENSQKALGIMIEKNIESVRFIFECNTISPFLESIRGRFCKIRIGYPSKEQIDGVIQKMVFQKFKRDVTPEELLKCHEIGCFYQNHLKHIFGSLFSYMITGKWIYISAMHKIDLLIEMIGNENIELHDFEKIREIIQELYIECVSYDIIIPYMMKKIFEKYKNQEQRCHEITALWVHYDNMMRLGNKTTMYLECFIIHMIELLHFSKKEVEKIEECEKVEVKVVKKSGYKKRLQK